jgi:hypothetical protein
VFQGAKAQELLPQQLSQAIQWKNNNG